VSNPILSDKTFKKLADNPGWGAPDPASRSTPLGGNPLDKVPMGLGPMEYTQVDDGPVSSWQTQRDTMTINGTVTATGVLMVLLVAAAAFGWSQVDFNEGFPPLAFGGVAIGFVCVIALMFKPMWAKFLAPVYAVAQGVFVGAISKFYEATYDGIVISAIGATLGVALMMLVLYRTRIIKVTNKFRKIVVAATMGLMAFYLVTFVLSLLDINIGAFRNEASPLGILFSVFAAGLAAMNLALDFDFIENNAKRGAPKAMEWVGAFGLLVTLVWLYLELLRLLSKLQQR
jgi:uncharacterized YccA/Bax inhibitor family protein